MKLQWIRIVLWLGLGWAVALPVSAFDRDTVSNLVLWISADSGVTTNASGTVTAWTDQSVSANSLSLLIGNPTYRPNIINAKPAVWFDGASDTLQFTRLSNIRTVFWVINEDSTATDNYRPLLGDSANYDFHRGAGYFFWDTGNASASVRGGETFVNGSSVGSGIGSIVPRELSVIVLKTTGNVLANQFGRDRWVDARAWHGYLAELLVYSHALTPQETLTVGQYLSSKYGIFTTYETLPTSINATQGVTSVQISSATVNGELTATGLAATVVTVFWGATNGGAVAENWAHTNNLGVREVGSFSTNLTGLVPDTLYYYICRATNGLHTSWSDPVWFRTAQASDPAPLRMKIQFRGYTRNELLKNIPLLVTFSNHPDRGFEYAQFKSPPYGDLRFSDTNGVALHYEVESWDTGGVSYVWVQVPQLKGTNTAIYAYWGSGGMSVPSYATNGMTWSEGYGGVWHFAETVTDGGVQKDSTVNANHGIFHDVNGSSFAGTNAGLIGRGNRFSGDADYVSVVHSASIQPAVNLTVEIWAKSATATWNDNGFLLSKRDAYLFHPNQGAKTVYFYAWIPASVGLIGTPSGEITDWHYFGGTHASGALRFFIDGGVVNSAAGGQALQGDGGELTLGRDDGQARYLNGWIDEARVSSMARSTNWIWACWLNQASNSVFIEYGSVESLIRATLFVIQ